MGVFSHLWMLFGAGFGRGGAWRGRLGAANGGPEAGLGAEKPTFALPLIVIPAGAARRF